MKPQAQPNPNLEKILQNLKAVNLKLSRQLRGLEGERRKKKKTDKK